MGLASPQGLVPLNHLVVIRAIWKHNPLPLVKGLLKLRLHDDDVGGIMEHDANLGLQTAEAGQSHIFTRVNDAESKATCMECIMLLKPGSSIN